MTVLEFIGTPETKQAIRAKSIGISTDFRRALMAVTILQDFSGSDGTALLAHWHSISLLTADEYSALQQFYGK